MGKQQIKAYNIIYHDDFIGNEDFKTIRASSEDEAIDKFEEDVEESYEIKDVELAYVLDSSSINDLVNMTDN